MTMREQISQWPREDLEERFWQMMVDCGDYCYLLRFLADYTERMIQAGPGVWFVMTETLHKTLAEYKHFKRTHKSIYLELRKTLKEMRLEIEHHQQAIRGT